MTNKDEITYVNPFLRGAAASIDMFIVGFLRVVFVQIVGSLYLSRKIMEFHMEFEQKFGVLFSAIDPEHVQFLAAHSVVKIMLLFLLCVILVGAIYHAFLNSSSWSATIGKRIFSLILVKNEGKSLSFWQAFWHYGLSLVPWVFMIYILLYQVKEKVTLYNAITANGFNLTLGFITVIWVQLHIITKKKNAIQDMIIDCSMVKGKVGKGWPKIRKQS